LLILDLFDAHSVDAFDLDPRMVALAPKAACGDAARLPAEDLLDRRVRRSMSSGGYGTGALSVCDSL
jgi:hypothetical protein